MDDSGVEALEGTEESDRGEPQTAADSVVEEPVGAAGKLPSRLVLVLGVGFAALFLAWTMRQTWYEVFPVF